MANIIDLYLGGFLILCGFGLSLLNLKRIVKKSEVSFPVVLLSENVLLTCIGIAFIARSLYALSPMSTELADIENRSASIMKNEEINCNFTSLLMGYGPLIVSLVNSFISLIIDNYMHYRMIVDVKQNEDENTVRELSDDFRVKNGLLIKNLFLFMKKYFAFLAVALQWIMPGLLTLAMYSIDIKQMKLMADQRSYRMSCMALLDVSEENCTLLNKNNTLQLPKYAQNWNFLELYEKEIYNTSDKRIDSIVHNVYNILANLQNDTYYADVIVTGAPLVRKAKQRNDLKCMKICFLENKNLLLYMFAITIVSFFVPVTISTIILTKIHIMNVKNQNVKTYVSRELLYNILFWTPVIFDTFYSMTLCSYTMSGLRTSIFNVIANVYQAVKNLMNTKYFKNNSILPV